MGSFSPRQGLGTLVNHAYEGGNPLHAHITPIYQTSTFSFPDLQTGMAIEEGREPGYVYTRVGAPNADQLARKVALLEGLDLARQSPDSAPESLVAGLALASGMAAVTAGVLGRVSQGETVLAQRALYGGTYGFFNEVCPRLGIRVAWVTDYSPAGWEAAFDANPGATLAYAETPVNPTMQVVDLEAVAALAHRHAAWLAVDNTFATPYCQRPLSLGADVVLHSTTKYISGHGATVGGIVVSRHPEFIRQQVQQLLELLGPAPSPFDVWLANLGLKTFELRMQRHCANALALARFLQSRPEVAAVHYPGLESHPDHPIARRQMAGFGGMLSFELKGGFPAAQALMDAVRVVTLAVSLGNTDSLIEHPASMTHSNLTGAERLKMGVSAGLMRFSTGIEDVEDLIADLDQALRAA